MTFFQRLSSYLYIIAASAAWLLVALIVAVPLEKLFVNVGDYQKLHELAKYYIEKHESGWILLIIIADVLISTSLLGDEELQKKMYQGRGFWLLVLTGAVNVIIVIMYLAKFFENPIFYPIAFTISLLFLYIFRSYTYIRQRPPVKVTEFPPSVKNKE